MRNLANMKRAMKNPRYSGMQNVVAQGQKDAGNGFDSRVHYGGASSRPLSRKAAYQLVQDPEGQLDSMRPDVLADAVKSGLSVGAVWGGLASASMAAVATALSTGRIDKKDLGHIAEARAVGALSSGAGSAATVLAGDAMAGGAVSGMVLALYNALKCDSVSCVVSEGAQGAAGTCAAVISAAVACPALAAATGPLSVVLCPVAVLSASYSARSVVKQLSI